MPIVLPIAWATVMCVPCVMRLNAGTDIKSASTRLMNTQMSAAKRKR